ncbi:MAG: TonB-dependent receptor, partial [Campylobacteraceae bacterium]
MRKIGVFVAFSTLCFNFGYADNATSGEINVVTKESLPTLSMPMQDIKVVDSYTTTPQTIIDSLKKDFFVDFRKSGAYASEPYMRGRGEKGVAAFIEGMRINGSHSDSVNLFGMSEVEEVDVYRGANGALFGNGAATGAVVLKLKDPKFSTTSDVKVSSFVDSKFSFLRESGYSGSVGTSVYNDLLSLSLSGSLNDYSDFKDGNGDKVLNSKYRSKHYAVSLGVKTSEDSFVYAKYLKDEADSQDPFSRFRNNNVWMYTARPNDEAKMYFLGFKKENIGIFKDLHVQLYKNELHYDVQQKRDAATPNQQQLFRDSDLKG